MKDIVLALFLLIACITDVRSLRIPNWLNVIAAATGICIQSVSEGVQGFTYAGLGLLAGFGAVLLLHVIGAVGAGDVKLFAAIGALSGVTFVLSALSYSIVFAACIGLVIVIVRRSLITTVKRAALSVAMLISLKDASSLTHWKHRDTLQFPFMLAVVPGAIAAYFQGA